MTTTTREIDDYVTAVHAALADLPDAEREDLLDDLPQHLADVQADRSGSLVELLGTPEAYAAELRATAGLDAPAHTRDWWQSARTRLASADERFGALLGYGRFLDLVRALAPAWWLVRGWLIVEAGTAAQQRSGRDALVPEIGGNRVAGVLLLALALAASVWLGRRGFPHQWQRVMAVIIGLALAVYGAALVRHASQRSVYYVDDSGGDDTASITNVYPVAPDGSVLTNIRLYDQDGNPVLLGNAVCGGDGHGEGIQDYDVPAPAASSAVAPTDGAALYPLTCAANQGPFGPSSHAPALPSAPASATPSASPTATPSASPSASPSR